MATPKTGLTVAIKFTPQAQADDIVLSEDQLNDRSQSLTNAADPSQNILANDGGGASVQVMAVIAGNAVDAVKADLAKFVDLANFASPKAAYASAALGDGHVDIVNGNVVFNSSHDYTSLALGEVATIGTFTYVIRMGNGAFSVTTSTIKIVGENDGPVAQADSASVHEDSALVGSVAANDFDPDNGETATLVYTLNGTAEGLTFNPDGSYAFDAAHPSYQHLAAGATQDIVVGYTVTDIHGVSAASTLTIHLTGTNDVPVAAVAANAGSEDAVIGGSVHATDADDGAVLTYAAAGQPPAGFTMNADGSYTLDASDAAYQHLAEGASQDLVIAYTATDEHGANSQSTLTVHLTGVNDAPVAAADGAVVDEDTVVTGSVAGNDHDPDDGAVLSYALTDDVAGLTFHADGSYSFDAGNAAYQPLVSGQTVDVVANYTVTDEHGATSQSTLTIAVHGANEAPPPPPPAEPTLHTATTEWTVTGQTDPNGGHLALQGTNWDNFHLSVNGVGDFDWDSEGFDLTGDATASYRGPNDHNSTGNAGPESTLNFSTGDVDVSLSLAALADGSFDYDVALTNPTQHDSEVKLTLTYDFWT